MEDHTMRNAGLRVLRGGLLPVSFSQFQEIPGADLSRGFQDIFPYLVQRRRQTPVGYYQVETKKDLYVGGVAESAFATVSDILCLLRRECRLLDARDEEESEFCGVLLCQRKALEEPVQVIICNDVFTVRVSIIIGPKHYGGLTTFYQALA